MSVFVGADYKRMECLLGFSSMQPRWSLSAKQCFIVINNALRRSGIRLFK